MIQRLNELSTAFCGKTSKSPRESYEKLIAKNNDTARKEFDATLNVAKSIPMQGTGEKLDVIA